MLAYFCFFKNHFYRIIFFYAVVPMSVREKTLQLCKHVVNHANIKLELNKNKICQHVYIYNTPLTIVKFDKKLDDTQMSVTCR